jgi:hypothetical protein
MPRAILGPLVAALVLVAASGCGRVPDAAPAAPAPVPAPVPASVPSTTGTTAAPAAPVTTVDPGTLAQTRDRPSASGPQWDRNVASLWRAIVTDDPAAAHGFFFPLTAYRQVKAIRDPDGDYMNRLLADFDQDIHTRHRQLGTSAATAPLAGIELGRQPEWIEPGVEHNKGPYWRVLDSALVYTDGGGRHSIPVKSMISWRGEWYVVHLTDIR